MYADNLCMQCMEVFKNFVELFVVFRNDLYAPFFFLSHNSQDYNTNWNRRTGLKQLFTFENPKLPNASGVAKANQNVLHLH